MKTLSLLRHAKSSWDSPGLSDRERGLNRRGQRDAPLMGSALAGVMAPTPAHVSPARRAQLTLEGVCEGWSAMGRLSHTTEEALYTFDHDSLVDWIRSAGEEQPDLFLIGHNPAFTDLVNTLTGTHTLDNLPTAGFVQLSLDMDRWDQLLHYRARLEHQLFPKQLK